jgi:putative hydrolase of the HAD superfamily
MVGDRLSTDIQGAQGVGMRAVWVNRDGKPPDSAIIPEWEITSLEELSLILGR